MVTEIDYIKGNHKVGGKTASQWAKGASRVKPSPDSLQKFIWEQGSPDDDFTANILAKLLEYTSKELIEHCFYESVLDDVQQHWLDENTCGGSCNNYPACQYHPELCTESEYYNA